MGFIAKYKCTNCGDWASVDWGIPLVCTTHRAIVEARAPSLTPDHFAHSPLLVAARERCSLPESWPKQPADHRDYSQFRLEPEVWFSTQLWKYGIDKAAYNSEKTSCVSCRAAIPQCPECGSRTHEIWSLEGPCPKCRNPMVESGGIQYITKGTTPPREYPLIAPEGYTLTQDKMFLVFPRVGSDVDLIASVLRKNTSVNARTIAEAVAESSPLRLHFLPESEPDRWWVQVDRVLRDLDAVGIRYRLFFGFNEVAIAVFRSLAANADVVQKSDV